MNLKINNRLRKISDFIYSEDKVIDIGCDHGLLGIYLVLNKKNDVMISSDINEMPLKKAKENIKKYNLESKIQTRLGNGIECVDDNLDTIVISGMGGLTINEILKNIRNYQNIKKIIISPNCDFIETRKYISKLGFFLDKEDMVYEKGKYYLISCYKKGKRKKINYLFGKLSFNEIVCDYFESVIKKNLIVLDNIKKGHVIKKLELNFMNYIIKKKIKKI